MTHSPHLKADIDRVRELITYLSRNANISSKYELEALALLDAGKDVEVVAYGMPNKGLILDCICPDEHESYEGSYTTPLYAITPDKEKTA